MKKVFSLLLVAIILVPAVFAVEDNVVFLKKIREILVRMTPFYENVSTCTPITVKDGFNNDYSVTGKKNGLCNVIIGDSYVCEFTDAAAKDYSKKMTAQYKEYVREIDENNSFVVSSEDPIAQYSDYVMGKYCKMIIHVAPGVTVTNPENYVIKYDLNR